MIDEFWTFYEQSLFNLYFHEEYFSFYKKIVSATNILTVAVSIFALSGWILSGASAILWSAIILSSQLISAIINSLGISEKTWALKYYLNDINAIANDIASDWRLIKSGILYEDKEIIDKIRSYNKSLADIENKYISSFSFDSIEWIVKKADYKANLKLKLLHGAGKEVEYA